MSHIFVCESIFYCSVNDLFAFHESKQGFETLIRANQKVEVIQAPNSIKAGEKAILKVEILPLVKMKWIALHTAYEPNRIFIDEQIEGPFPKFIHSHIFESHENGSKLIDKIELDFPLFLFSRFVLEAQLRTMFLKRHRLTAEALKVNHKNLKVGFK